VTPLKHPKLWDEGFIFGKDKDADIGNLHLMVEFLNGI
jgi:hypothetical protein